MEKIVVSIGSLLKSIRIERGYTQEYVSRNIVSRPYLSLIESNRYSPSVTILIELLDRLNIDLDEFIFLLYNDKNKSQKEIRFTPFKEYANYSKKDYQMLLKSLRQQYKDTNEIKYYHLCIVIEAHRRLSGKENLDMIRQLVKPIKKYLQKINGWVIYDFRLFNNTMFCFTVDEILAMMPMISNYIKKYELFFQEQVGILSFLANFCILLIMEAQYEQAIDYANLGKSIAQQHNQLYHEIFLDSVVHYSLFRLQPEESSHLQHLEENLAIAKKFNCQLMIDFFEDVQS